MTLAEKLKKQKADFLAMAPKEAAEAMGAATQELIDSGMAEKALGVGAKFPSFELENQDGEMVTSQELLASGELVLSFYRGKW